MAWETALDRLLLQQIHSAEKGEVRPAAVQQQILDLWSLAPDRATTAFHLGYGRALLGIELPEPEPHRAAARRWYLFGRLRGHDRQGERSWVAELIEDRQGLIELLQEPRIAAQCLPVLMRTLFGTGELQTAVKVVEFLAVEDAGEEQELLVDAAITDMLTRLESVGGGALDGDTVAVLIRCLATQAFRRLPADVRARYHKVIASRMLAVSDFRKADDELVKARELSRAQTALRSGIDTMRVLAMLQLHSVQDLWPLPDRQDGDRARDLVDAALMEEGGPAAGEACYVGGLLHYEKGSWSHAADLLERALDVFREKPPHCAEILDRSRYFYAAAVLAGELENKSSKAMRLLEDSLAVVKPDLESFYPVYEALKERDRKLALRFLDAVDVGRGTSADQLLIVALEYLGLGEAEPAMAAAEQVLQVAVNLDQRIEAMRTVLTAQNMRGDRDGAQSTFHEIREILLQRGAFEELENLLRNEEFVGQALDHLEIKCELVTLYEEMEERGAEKAMLQAAVARTLRARKDVESLQQAFAILQEVELDFPDLARDELQSLGKLLEHSNAEPVDSKEGPALVKAAAAAVGHTPTILVVGGNERQRRHHPRFAKLAQEWGFQGEWLMANYKSPQKLVGTIGDRVQGGVDLLVLLHWNRHETTEPALELARDAGVPARTVHYAGFTSLQVALGEMLTRMAGSEVKA